MMVSVGIKAEFRFEDLPMSLLMIPVILMFSVAAFFINKYGEPLMKLFSYGLRLGLIHFYMELKNQVLI